MKPRKIDQRFRPRVSGIDLWQAMNYIALKDVTTDFIYNAYTSSVLGYVPGSRPGLERLARKVAAGVRSSEAAVDALVRHVAREIRWAGFYEQQEGRRLPADRNLSEERIAASRFGWCNEQARLVCALAIVSGIPARLVFGSNAVRRYGHVVCEALTGKGWMLVDPSLGFCFMRAGQPVNAWAVYHDSSMRRYFAPRYRALCRRLEADLGRDLLERSFAMAITTNPLNGFRDLGFCNHFV